MQNRLIGIGETTYDIIFSDDSPVAAVPGGSAFNAVCSAARTGTPAAMVTQVGDDHIGRLTRRYLDQAGVDTTYVEAPQGWSSPVSLAFLDADSNADYLFYKRTPTCLPASLPRCLKGDIVLFGSYFAHDPRHHEALAAYLAQARADGATLYYDINFRRSHAAELPTLRPIIESNARLAHVVRASDEDLAIIGPVNLAAPCLITTRGSRDTTVQCAGGVSESRTVASDCPHAGGVGFCPHAGRLGFRPSASLVHDISFAGSVRGQSEATVRLSDTCPACGQKPTPPARGKNATSPPCPAVLMSFPAEHVDHVVSTVGAGDNFNAGFCCEMIRQHLTGPDLPTATPAQWQALIATAHRYAAAVCRQQGGSLVP